MAILKVGSLQEFSVNVKSEAIDKNLLDGVRTFNALAEISREVPFDAFQLVTSQEERGVALKQVKLEKGFEGFIRNIWNETNEIYFIAWAWDLSGQPIHYYPGIGTNLEDVKIRIKTGKIREFIGQGINLFPKRKVVGGIAIRLQIWESDQGERNFGKVMSEISDTINNSDVNKLLSIIALATGVPGATISLIEKASLELTSLIGKILQKNSNDYVDLFEGYYASDNVWGPADENYEGNDSQIILKKY